MKPETNNIHKSMAELPPSLFKEGGGTSPSPHIGTSNNSVLHCAVGHLARALNTPRGLGSEWERGPHGQGSILSTYIVDQAIIGFAK